MREILYKKKKNSSIKEIENIQLIDIMLKVDLGRFDNLLKICTLVIMDHRALPIPSLSTMPPIKTRLLFFLSTCLGVFVDSFDPFCLCFSPSER